MPCKSFRSLNCLFLLHFTVNKEQTRFGRLHVRALLTLVAVAVAVTLRILFVIPAFIPSLRSTGIVDHSVTKVDISHYLLSVIYYVLRKTSMRLALLSHIILDICLVFLPVFFWTQSINICEFGPNSNVTAEFEFVRFVGFFVVFSLAV